MCARPTERTCMCVLHKLPLGWSPPIASRRVLLPPPSHPYFFLTTHSLFLFLSFAAIRYSTTMLPASFAIVSTVKSGASQRQTKRSVRRRWSSWKISLDAGESAGGTGQRVLSTPRRDSSHEGGRKAALPPLENPSSLFCANSSTLDRGSPLEELADAWFSSRTIFLRLAKAQVFQIFPGINNCFLIKIYF